MLNGKTIGMATFAFIITVASITQAQTPQSAKQIDDGRGYTYEFKDDPLAAGGLDPRESNIWLPRRTVRGTLIRLRANFIPQLLKSVENL